MSNALRALRRHEVLRWLSLLECSDLMLDILLGYLALYFVDVVGVTAPQPGLTVAVWMGVELLGSLVLIPLLAYMPGLCYLRISAALAAALFPTFLLVPGFGLKVMLLGLFGFCNAGWYSVLKGRLYSAMPGQSGTVLSVSSVFGLARALLPLALGLVAQRFHLSVARWLLLLGPIALLLGLPTSGAQEPPGPVSAAACLPAATSGQREVGKPDICLEGPCPTRRAADAREARCPYLISPTHFATLWLGRPTRAGLAL